MHDDHDSPAPSSNELRQLRRPPYGLSPWYRPRLLTASDSLSWRRYSAPVPPERSSFRSWDRLTRPALITGFLACVALGIWSSVWSTDSTSPRTKAAPIPTPRLSVSERSLITSPPPSMPAPRRPPLATPSPSPKVSKNRATSSGSLHRSAVSAVPRQRRESVPAAPRRKTKILVDRARGPKRS